MMRYLAIAILLALPSQKPTFVQSDDWANQAIGLGSIEEICADAQWRDRLNVSPQQHERLQKLLTDPQFQTKVKSYVYNFDNRESWVHFNQFPEMNRFVADSVKDILLPQQVEKRRTLYLKERFRSPMAILRGQGVHELFRGDTNFEKILLGLPNVRAGVERNTQNERRTVLQQLFKAFPDIQPQFEEIFGPLFENSSDGFSLRSLGVLDCTRGTLVLNATMVPELGFELVEKPSQEQAAQLRQLYNEIDWKDPNFPRDAFAINGVRKILSDKQFSGVILTLHKLELRSDFPIDAQRVVAYLKVPPEDIDRYQQVCGELKDAYLTSKRKVELAALNKLFAMADKQRTEYLTEFFKDVWDP